MKKFYLKAGLLVLIIYIPVLSINYLVDPAQLFQYEFMKNAVNALNSGNIIQISGDMDEGQFQKAMINSMKNTPETVVIGSSHIMYVPWEYEDYYIAGLSGAYLGDYYAILGLFESNNMLPQRIVIGVDPWAFMTSYNAGRHSSISSYSDYEHELIITGERIVIKNDNSRLKKVKEIFNFSYFQSSFVNLRKKGIKYYISGRSNNITVAEDEQISDVQKILPNARRIMPKAGFLSIEENNNAAESAISSKGLYQLGSELSSVNGKNFNDFKMLLIYLQDKCVDVELYLPSWYPVIYDYFSESENYAGVIELEAMIRDLGKELNITVHGSYNPHYGKVTVEDFADWLHLKPKKMLENYKVIVE